MELIVGLGNVGKQYENTHHNVGFLVVEKLSERLGAAKEKKMCEALVSEANKNQNKVLLAKPTTFMNASGVAVRSLQKKFAPDCTIVVHDDVDLPCGVVRIRTKGSAGSHNGMKSVIEHAVSEFVRVRVGIGKPIEGQDLGDFVLSKIPKSSNIWQGIEIATDAIFELVCGLALDEVCQKYSK